MEEAASSALMPTFPLLAFRVIFSATAFAYLAIYIVNKVRNSATFPGDILENIMTAFHFLLAVSLMLAARCTYTYRMQNERDGHERSWLAFWVVFLFQISASLFLSALPGPISHGTEGNKFILISRLVTSLVPIAFELFISLRMQFKLAYAGVFVAILSVLLFGSFARFGWLGIDSYTGGFVIIVLFFWFVISGLAVILLSRINRLPLVNRGSV